MKISPGRLNRLEPIGVLKKKLNEQTSKIVGSIRLATKNIYTVGVHRNSNLTPEMIRLRVIDRDASGYRQMNKRVNKAIRGD